MPPARAALLTMVLLGWTVAGCGKKGPPLPPEPRGPLPPGDVVARQIGEEIVVSFNVPAPRGEKAAQQPVRAEIVKVVYDVGQPAPADPDAFRRRGLTVAVLDRGPWDPGRRLSAVDATPDWSAGAAGLTLRYGVRVLDRRGRSSPLVVSRDLVTVEPLPAPDRLAAEATGDGVRLTWDAPSADPARFNVYRTTDPDRPPERPLNASPVTSTEFLDADVATGNTYTYVVRTTVADAPPFRESSSSAPVVVVAEDRFAPRPPDGLVVVQEGNAIRLFWNPNEERDLLGYRVYRRVDGGDRVRVGPDVVEQPLYLDEDVEAEQRIEYWVSAVDLADPPNESDPSASAIIDVALEPANAGE